MTQIAQCCCGNTKIQVTSEPTIHSVCNCNNCKQRTGSAFGISAYFLTENVEVIKDSTSTYALTTEYGHQARHFCNQCGTTLFWTADALKGMTGIAGGCFTDKPLPQPQFNAMKDNQCEWVRFADEMNKSFTAADRPRDNINRNGLQLGCTNAA